VHEDSIVKPWGKPGEPALGPVAVLVAPGPDVNPMRSAMGLDGVRPQPLFGGGLYTGEGDGPSLAGPFIGAPHAVMMLEAVVRRGARWILFFGWCGAVDPMVNIGDLVVPDGALVDEGTSHHYGHESGDAVWPSAAVQTEIRRSLRDKGRVFHQGTVWTTDAVFRETPRKVRDFQARGAAVVEMEMSALFTAGAWHGIAVGGLLAVSDDVSQRIWKRGFRHPAFIRGRRSAVEVIGDVCQRRSKS